MHGGTLAALLDNSFGVAFFGAKARGGIIQCVGWVGVGVMYGAGRASRQTPCFSIHACAKRKERPKPTHKASIHYLRHSSTFSLTLFTKQVGNGFTANLTVNYRSVKNKKKQSCWSPPFHPLNPTHRSFPRLPHPYINHKLRRPVTVGTEVKVLARVEKIEGRKVILFNMCSFHPSLAARAGRPTDIAP